MKVWGLYGDVPDTYDVGTHEELLDLFRTRELAELVRSHLIGLPRLPHGCHLWADYELTIEELEIR